MSESLKRYPLLHLKMAVLNTLEQLVTFETGDGIEPLNDIPVPAMMRHMPDQLDDYRASRQQRDRIDFDWINALHIPVGGLSIIALGAILIAALWRRLWTDRVFLPVFPADRIVRQRLHLRRAVEPARPLPIPADVAGKFRGNPAGRPGNGPDPAHSRY